MRYLFLRLYHLVYRYILWPPLSLLPAQKAHHLILSVLGVLDRMPPLVMFLRLLHRLAYAETPCSVGGVQLQHPFIFAAGFVKGLGFEDEQTALQAVHQGRNIIMGWRAVPALVGAVEFGSFTRRPLIGNQGVVIWRDNQSRSTQNRVGLRNPGAVAAAEFLARHRHALPPIFGVNIAPMPGTGSAAQEIQDIIESLAAFLERGGRPSWFTLNLSCPNTEDDPSGRQTEAHAEQLCSSIIAYLRQHGDVPLWVKISPNLSAEQYSALMQVFQRCGVCAVIATNTLPQPSPTNAEVMAGVGGGRLFPAALAAVRDLSQSHADVSVDIIACGGILDGESWCAYRSLGVKAAQYYSAFIFRGPLAAVIIESESQNCYDHN
ncbi:MAG: hypothetical protein D6712_04470 [Chloroflexi bacterium]|nr:MAG: hypothetical protein D6712_04470 [Chloroflexota bacterium]